MGIAKQLHETSLAGPYRNPNVDVADSGAGTHWMDFECIHQNVDHTLISNQTPSALKWRDLFACSVLDTDKQQKCGKEQRR